MEINELHKSDYSKAASLLEKMHLPFQDVYSVNLKLYEVTENDETIAIGGFKTHGSDAILRSIAVMPNKQLKGTGRFIVDKLENFAIKDGIENFYLLTTSAEPFFEKHDYKQIHRELVPETIRLSGEFTQPGYESAICMRKKLSQKYVPLIIMVNNEIALKQIELTDAQAIFDIIDNQRPYLSKWLPFVAHTHNINNTINFIQSSLNTPKNEREFVFVIKYKSNIVGICGFRDTDPTNRKTEIGYWLSQHEQGKGVVTQCVKKMIHFAFIEMELNRIQIKCAVGNTKSSRLPKNLNFHFEGIERSGEIFPDGSFKDLEIYSLLKHDYKI